MLTVWLKELFFTVSPSVSQDFPINPKSLSLGELYGEYNLSTNEWSDGVLSAVMRTQCAGDQPTD